MKFKIFIIVAILAVLSVFWLFFGARKDGKITGNNIFPSTVFKKETSNETKFSSTPTVVLSVETKKYKNGKYGFSFNYPDDFTVNELTEEDGKTVLVVQNAKTGEGLQIYITAYDDSGFVASKERILRDVPDLPFSNSADVIVGGKAKGVAFFSENEVFGETAEVWFADDGKFYQATSYGKDAKLLEEIVKSWKFQ